MSIVTYFLIFLVVFLSTVLFVVCCILFIPYWLIFNQRNIFVDVLGLYFFENSSKNNKEIKEKDKISKFDYYEELAKAREKRKTATVIYSAKKIETLDNFVEIDDVEDIKNT